MSVGITNKHYTQAPEVLFRVCLQGFHEYSIRLRISRIQALTKARLKADNACRNAYSCLAIRWVFMMQT